MGCRIHVRVGQRCLLTSYVHSSQLGAWSTLDGCSLYYILRLPTHNHVAGRPGNSIRLPWWSFLSESTDGKKLPEPHYPIGSLKLKLHRVCFHLEALILKWTFTRVCFPSTKLFLSFRIHVLKREPSLQKYPILHGWKKPKQIRWNNFFL